jgi:hypothetical protein
MAERQQNKKKSITFSVPDQFVAILESRADLFTGMNRSSQLMLDLETYWAILENGLSRARRVLTRREAKMVLDIQNGSWLGSGPEAVMWMQSGLIHNVYDGIYLNAADEKWSVDGKAVLAKLNEMGDVPRLALADWARRMWSHYQDNELWEAELAKFQLDPTPELTDEEHLANAVERLNAKP